MLTLQWIFVLHDTQQYILLGLGPLVADTKEKMDPNYKDYVEQFWLGLLEGEGTLWLNKNKGKNKTLYAVFGISLKYLEENEKLLILISEVVGGKVHYERKDGEIIKVN